MDLQVGSSSASSRGLARDRPQVKKAEVGFTRDIEKVLSELKGPLEVTHNVSPAEVLANLEAWRPAIEKEVKGIQVGIERLLPGSEARRSWLNKTRAQRLPTKFVFTIKPNEQADPNKQETWYKRKARLATAGI